MKPLLWVAGAGLVATLAVLLFADGPVEFVGYELLVVAVAAGAFVATAPLLARRGTKAKAIHGSLASTRNHPPQLTRLEWLVEFSVSSSVDAESRLIPELRLLAASRLRDRHGIDLTSEPQRVRAVIGAPAWSILSPDRLPSSDERGIDLADLDEVVSAIESL